MENALPRHENGLKLVQEWLGDAFSRAKRKHHGGEAELQQVACGRVSQHARGRALAGAAAALLVVSGVGSGSCSGAGDGRRRPLSRASSLLKQRKGIER